MSAIPADTAADTDRRTTMRVMLHADQGHWRLRIARNGKEIYRSTLSRSGPPGSRYLTTDTDVAHVHIAAEHRTVNAILTVVRLTGWRQIPGGWTADVREKSGIRPA